ncbi:hypothetical protein BC936DRAFT_141681 [Jimgerdemannia flammicorona]|uniref:RZ-type domain-containing protein n=1 Tax=Jimgerdemannia flammicorona TaxID=994334 RepID=A0A433DMP6_9FUNG|nr:hypothetical protein BC936DRAFT_141681 [Jimgerdemannia flammicorona]
MPCNRRCDKTLDCGHRCPSVCGEKCPKTKFCVICADDQTKNMLVDLIMQQSLCDVDVDDDPILVMSCGHALTMSSMDGVMEMSEYYVESFVPENLSTIFTSCRPLPGEEVKQQSCHLCRKPIVELFRYGRRIKYAQLGTRSKKLLKQQSIAIGDAKEGLRTAQRLLETNEAQFISSISKINAEVRQDTPMESRRLRTLPPSLQYVPEEWFRRIADIYGIPKEQEAAWCKHILPVVSSYRKFRKINDKAFNSPAKQLFDAAVSHLYRAKTSGALGQFGEPAGAYDDDDDDYYNTPTSASAVIEACIRECGLPPGGFDGSPFIESLQELVNVLILVQHQVVVVLDTVGLSSGWYWLADDLIECIRLHVERLMVATEEKKYYRHLAYGRLTMMEALLKKVQLLGRSHTNTTRPHRIAVADELAARFGMEAAILEEYCPLGIKDECMARLQAVEEKMTKAINIAKSGMFYAPVTEQEKVELFRAISQEVRGSGHWPTNALRNPLPAQYVIADCGNANQVSQCPECRATIGGSGSLVAGNVRDAEFEGMIGRININQ